jgi:Secretion system C-terminal sorting domain
MRKLLLILTIVACTHVQAQYRGGRGDGVAGRSTVLHPLQPNIYTGGKNDGFAQKALTIYSVTTENSARFRGGRGDGVASASTVLHPLQPNIYTGGKNDGFAQKTLTIFPTTWQNYNFPVVWQQFAIESVNCTARLNWVTSSELNTASFEIEKSSDGSNFDQIAEVEATNAGAVQSRYVYNDPSENRQRVYYRIKSLDFDGRVSYSEVLLSPSNGCEQNAIQLSAFPNPTQNRVTIQGFSARKDRVTVQVFALDGSLIHSVELGEVEQSFEHTFDLQNYATGIYAVCVRLGRSNSQTLRIVKTE